jgi:hypothetical protein
MGLGGPRNSGSVIAQVKDQVKHCVTTLPWNWENKYPDTVNVALNPLTWSIRNTNIEANVSVSEDGSMAINYHLWDTLDLRPNRPEGNDYNKVTGVLGFVWHRILRGSEMETEANWTVVYPEEE